MRIVITGAGGVLGREVVLEALKEGHTIIGIDRDLSVSQHEHSSFIQRYCDTADYDALLAALEGADAILHLAALGGVGHADHVVHNVNAVSSYNVLRASTALGITRVVMASSTNAIGTAHSRVPKFQYFPINEAHPSFTEDPYGLSKWIGEVQAWSIARRYHEMTIASLRFHWVVKQREEARRAYQRLTRGTKQLWGYTLMSSAVRACLLSLKAEYRGHHVLYIVEPITAVDVPSRTLAGKFYPNVPIQGDFVDNTSFYDCSKAQRTIGF